MAAKAPRKVLGSSGGGGAGASNVASPSSSGGAIEDFIFANFFESNLDLYLFRAMYNAELNQIYVGVRRLYYLLHLPM